MLGIFVQPGGKADSITKFNAHDPAWCLYRLSDKKGHQAKTVKKRHCAQAEIMGRFRIQ
jgi:hypothetical protein